MSQATRNTLLCFDAFGTLFKPRQPIYAQYGEIARKYGVDSFTDDELKMSFKRGMSNCAFPVAWSDSVSVQSSADRTPKLWQGIWYGYGKVVDKRM